MFEELIIKKGETDYEFRNTAVPSFVNEEDIPSMGDLVKGARHFVFQQFVPGDTLDRDFIHVKPYPPQVIEGFAKIMKKYVDQVTLRV